MSDHFMTLRSKGLVKYNRRFPGVQINIHLLYCHYASIVLIDLKCRFNNSSKSFDTKIEERKISKDKKQLPSSLRQFWGCLIFQSSWQFEYGLSIGW